MNNNIKSRIQHLDGLRGVAILVVLLHHAYSRWGELIEGQKDTFLSNLFTQGSLGVQLFFMISGFVIVMSLKKTENFFYFLYKRWLRLFPAMFVFSLIAFLLKDLFLDRPAGIINFVDLLPGLTFIEPAFYNKIFQLNVPVKSLDGVFWSLYAEVKFYIFISFFYFFLKDKKCFSVICAYALFVLFKFLDFDHPLIVNCLIYSGFAYFGFFSLGILAYHCFFEKNIEYKNLYKYSYIGLALIVLLHSQFRTPNIIELLNIIIIIFVFYTSFNNIFINIFLTNNFLIFFGFISYPLYLIHQYIVADLTIKINSLFDSYSFLFPILPMLCVIFIAFIIAKYFEKNLRNFILNIQRRISQKY
jgi:peptidoglycan/LPS O-acetylase OafA/YrhL